MLAGDGSVLMKLVPAEALTPVAAAAEAEEEKAAGEKATCADVDL